MILFTVIVRPAAEKKQQHEANQSIGDHEERKIDDPLDHNSESMNRAMSVQALFHRGISNAFLPQAGRPSLLSSGISSNAVLQILTQERARAALPPRVWTTVPGLAHQNTMNTSGTNLAGSFRGPSFATEINQSSGVSPLVTDYLLSSANLANYQRRLDAALASSTSLSVSFQGLPNVGASGLSPSMIQQVLSRANAIHSQRNLDQALAIIAGNETVQRVRQVPISQSNHGIAPDLYAAMQWNNSSRHHSVSQIADIRNRAFLPNGPLANAMEASSLTLPTEARERALLAAFNGTRSFAGLPQSSVAERIVESNAANSQRPDSNGVLLATADDEKNLSEYQALVRKQLEFFEANDDDVSVTTQGRKKIVYIGQVGIRCIHCAHRPADLRSRGSVYFPSKLSSTYQAAQNMAVSHLMDACDEIDESVREQLCALRLRKDTAAGGKAYWASSCAKVGVSETETGLRLTKALHRSQSS